MEKIIHNVETNEITKIDLSQDEINEILKQSAELEKKYETQNEAIKEKEQARKSALSKLIDLGLTEEEIAAL